MKRTLLCIVLVMMIMLSACLPTPQEEYVVNKGDNIAGEVISATAVPDETQAPIVFPECWEDGIRTDFCEMVIDADITTAGMESFPVHLVGRHYFQPGEAVSAGNTFFNNMTGVQKGWGPIREDLEAAIETIKHAELPEETREAQLEMLEIEAASARPSESGFKETSSFAENMMESGRENVFIVRQEDGRNGLISFTGSELFLSRSINGAVQTKSLVEDGNGYAGEKDASVETDLTLDFAIESSEEFFESAGAEGFVLTESEEARMLNRLDLTVINTGYRLLYMRTFGYTPVNTIERDASYINAMDTIYGDYDYSMGWRCEWIEIYISDNGVEYFDWHNPIEDKGVENENVRLMELDELKEIIKRYFTVRLNDPTRLYLAYFSVEEMVLSAVPTGIKGSANGYMMPVWILRIGRYHSMADDSYTGFRYPGEQRMLDWFVVAFNALDGTRVVIPAR